MIDALELANKTLHSDRDIDLLKTRDKEDRLEERIDELDKEKSELHDRGVALEAEKA